MKKKQLQQGLLAKPSMANWQNNSQLMGMPAICWSRLNGKRRIGERWKGEEDEGGRKTGCCSGTEGEVWKNKITINPMSDYKITHEFNGWKYIQDTSKDHAISFVKCTNLLPGCYHDIDGMKNMFFDLPEDSIVYGDSAYTGTTMKKFAESQL